MVHKMHNLVPKLPEEAVPGVKDHLDAVFRVPIYEAGQNLAAEVLEKHRRLYLSVMKAFSENPEVCQVHLRPPVVHGNAKAHL